MPNTRNFDDFPIYDPVTTNNGSLSAIWQAFFATFNQTLISYLTAYGVLLPQLTAQDKTDLAAPYVALIGSPIGTLPDISGLTAWDFANGVPIVFKITFAAGNIATAAWHTYTIV